MTKSQEIYRKQLLTRIHTTALYKQIKAADAWEDWLGFRFGVYSCKELSISELERALDILCGRAQDGTDFKPDILGRNLIYNASADRVSAIKRSEKDAKPAAKRISPSQFARISALAACLGMDERGLLGFTMRQCKILLGKKEQLAKLSAANASKLITGLSKIAQFRASKGQV